MALMLPGGGGASEFRPAQPVAAFMNKAQQELQAQLMASMMKGQTDVRLGELENERQLGINRANLATSALTSLDDLGKTYGRENTIGALLSGLDTGGMLDAQAIWSGMDQSTLGRLDMLDQEAQRADAFNKLATGQKAAFDAGQRYDLTERVDPSHLNIPLDQELGLREAFALDKSKASSGSDKNKVKALRLVTDNGQTYQVELTADTPEELRAQNQELDRLGFNNTQPNVGTPTTPTQGASVQNESLQKAMADAGIEIVGTPETLANGIIVQRGRTMDGTEQSYGIGPSGRLQPYLGQR